MPNILLEGGYISLEMLCKNLSISYATGKNWVKLGKLIPECTKEGIPFFSEDYLNELKKYDCVFHYYDMKEYNENKN